MNKKMIIDAYCRIRQIDQTIPDEVLDFMKDASLEKLNNNDIRLTYLEEVKSKWGESNVIEFDEWIFDQFNKLQ